MKVSQLIICLNNLRKKHGDVDVIGVAPHYSTYDIEEGNVSYLEKDGHYIGDTAIYIGPD